MGPDTVNGYGEIEIPRKYITLRQQILLTDGLTLVSAESAILEVTQECGESLSSELDLFHMFAAKTNIKLRRGSASRYAAARECDVLCIIQRTS